MLGQVKTGQVRTGPVRTGQLRKVKSGQVNSEEAKSRQVKSAQVMSDYVISGPVHWHMSSPVTTGQVKLGKVKSNRSSFLDIKHFLDPKQFRSNCLWPKNLLDTRFGCTQTNF